MEEIAGVAPDENLTFPGNQELILIGTYRIRLEDGREERIVP